MYVQGCGASPSGDFADTLRDVIAAVQLREPPALEVESRDERRTRHLEVFGGPLAFAAIGAGAAILTEQVEKWRKAAGQPRNTLPPRLLDEVAKKDWCRELLEILEDCSVAWVISGSL